MSEHHANPDWDGDAWHLEIYAHTPERPVGAGSEGGGNG
jgi:hypothetical protein